MKHAHVTIKPELSAQRRTHPPNPALPNAIRALLQSDGDSDKLGRIADLGCGKLRHYDQLLRLSTEFFLIDTSAQLSANHVDQGLTYNVLQVAQSARKLGRKVYAITSEEFAKSKLRLRAIFCIAVLDVIPRPVRRTLIESAARNLALRGSLVIIAPRNDSTILRRCTPGNSYLDGHVFENHGAYTFFHNFRQYDDIIKDCKQSGLELFLDLSRYRQVCLLFSKQGTRS